MPLISMIVPVYNVENYLARCINSILAQTFEDFELILIDDGSTDNCSSICDEYAKKDDRIVVIHQKNSGVSNARNTGLDHAKGEYITFCDSDDYVDEDFLEHLYHGIVCKKVDCYSSNFRYVDDSNVLMTSKYLKNFTKFRSKEDLIQYLLMNVLGYKQKCGWIVVIRIFKKSIIEKYHIRFCETCDNYAEDLGFVLEYTLKCQSVCTEEYCGYNYYKRDNSMMHNSENIIKIDEVNEVAFHFMIFWNNDTSLKKYNKYLPVIFWGITMTEYFQVLEKKLMLQLPEKINSIKRKKWYINMNRRVVKSYFLIKRIYDVDYAHRSFIGATFCLHRNINVFRLQTKIYYKSKGY